MRIHNFKLGKEFYSVISVVILQKGVAINFCYSKVWGSMETFKLPPQYRRQQGYLIFDLTLDHNYINHNASVI